MPDDRLFHKRLGRSAKVGGLTDLGFRVWVQYELSADDFGVMRFSPRVVQADNENLGRRSTRPIAQALDSLVHVGLIRLFDHQSQAYAFQPDWQNFQHVRYPKNTVNPQIPHDVLGACTRQTQWLNTVWPGGDRKKKLTAWDPPDEWASPWASDGTVPEPFPNGSELRARGPMRGGAGNGSRLTATALGSGGAGGASASAAVLSDAAEPDLADRAERFVVRYGELHQRHRHGARYMGRAQADLDEALQLVQVYDDERLAMLATAFLNTDDEFSNSGTRTIAKFRSRASWCDERLRAKGL